MSKYQHFNWFDRVYNSSVGLLAQVPRRLWKVASTDAELFSEEGILDASLVPIFGAFDKHRKDISSEEFIQFALNDDLGMDLESDSFLNNLLVELVTDPTTFLTGGATAGAKAARAVNKIKRNSAFTAEVTEDMTVGALKQQTDEIIEKQLGGLKDRAALRRERMELDKLDDDMTVSDLSKQEGDRQLMVALPFLEKYESMRFATLSPEKKSWMRIGWDGTYGSKPVAKATAAVVGTIVPYAKKIPGLSHAIHGLADAYHANGLAKKSLGLRVGSAPPSKAFVEGEGAKLAEELQEFGVPYKSIVNRRNFDEAVFADRYENNLGKSKEYANRAATSTDKKRAGAAKKASEKWAAKSNEEKFLAAWGRRTSGMTEVEIEEEAHRLWKQFTFGEDIPFPKNGAELRAQLDNYMPKMQGSVERITNAGMTAMFDTAKFDAIKEGEKLEGFGKLVYKSSLNARKSWNKIFRTDFKSGDISFLESERLLRRDVGRMTSAVQERANVLLPLLKNGAEEVNMTPEQFDSMILSFMEGAAADYEIEELLPLAAEDPEKYIGAAYRYIQRSAASMDRVADILRKSGQHQAADQIDAVGGLRRLRDGVVTEYKEKAPKFRRKKLVDAPDIADGAPSERFRLENGIQLGYLSKKQLNKEKKKLLKSFEEGKRAATVLKRAEAGIISDAQIKKLQGDKLRKVLDKYGIDEGTAPKNKAKLRELMADKRKLRDEAKARIEAAAKHDEYAETALERIDALLEQRRRGQAPRTWDLDPPTPRKPIRDEPAAGTFESEGIPDEVLDSDAVFEPIDDVEYFTSDVGLGESYTRMVERITEAKTVLEAGGKVDQTMLRDISNAMSGYSGWMQRAMHGALGDSGKRALTVLQDTHKQVFLANMKAGVVSAGSPLAYVGRYLGPGQRQVLRAALGAASTSGVLDTAMPQLSSLFARNLDELSMHELNNLVVELDKLAPNAEYTSQLKEIASNVLGEEPTKYADSAGLSVLNSYAQAQRRATTAQFVDDLLDKGVESGTSRMQGFEVVGVVDTTQGQTVDIPKLKTRLDKSGRKVTVKLEDETQVVDMRGVILRGSDGEEVFVDMRDLRDGWGILDLGTRGNTYGEAFAIGIADGSAQAGGKKLFHADNFTKGNLSDLVGKKVLAGSREMISEAAELVTAQFKASSKVGVTIDYAHTQIKALQTVWRPDFHIANLASSMFQAMMTDGVGITQVAGGFNDAIRLLFGDQRNITDTLDMASELLDDQKGVRALLRPGRFAERVRRRGVLGGVKAEGVAENAIFKFGDQQITMEEIFDIMDKEGLLGTFVQEGLRGTSSISDTLIKLRDNAFAGKGGKRQAIREFQELSETTARVMSVFAHMRSGYSLESAVRFTREAMVDYANTTRFEQTWLKRAFSYYTFPRRYIPHAIKQLDGDPSKLSTIQGLISAGTEHGNLALERGSLQFEMSEGRQVDIGRMAAPLDAAMALPALMNAAGAVVPGVLLPGEQFSSIGDRAEGAPGLTEASAAFQIGSPWAVAFSALNGSDRPGDPTFMEELARISPVSRWAMTRLTTRTWSGKEGVPRGFGEELAFQILPYTQQEPNYDLKRLRSTHLQVQRAIQKKVEMAQQRGDQDAVKRWVSEYQDIGAMLGHLAQMEQQ